MAFKIKGIDISYCQKGLDFKQVVSDGYKFAIIRISHRIKADTEFENHISNCIKYKIPWGVYVYSEAMTVSEAKAEAEFCIKLLGGRLPNYPVFFDMEMPEQVDNLSSGDRTAICKAFCERIKSAKLFPAVYANPAWLRHYYENDTVTNDYDLWLAHWVSDGKQADYGQHIWQHGIVNIGGMDVDGNYCYINYPAKIKTYYDSVRNVANTDDNTNGDTPANQKPTDTGKTSAYKSGDKVKLNKGANFSDGTKPYDFVYNTEYGIIQLSKNGKEALIGIDGEATGWVFISDLTMVGTAASASEVAALNIGDKVKLASGAPPYETRKQFASWVYSSTLYLRELSGNRAVISTLRTGAITGAVDKKYLTKI